VTSANTAGGDDAVIYRGACIDVRDDNRYTSCIKQMIQHVPYRDHFTSQLEATAARPIAIQTIAML
jgi:hypothetical protein